MDVFVLYVCPLIRTFILRCAGLCDVSITVTRRQIWVYLFHSYVPDPGKQPSRSPFLPQLSLAIMSIPSHFQIMSTIFHLRVITSHTRSSDPRHFCPLVTQLSFGTWCSPTSVLASGTSGCLVNEAWFLWRHAFSETNHRCWPKHWFEHRLLNRFNIRCGFWCKVSYECPMSAGVYYRPETSSQKPSAVYA